MAEINRVYRWGVYRLRLREAHIRKWARLSARIFAACHPEFRKVLTAGERSEQYADEYARAATRLDTWYEQM